MRTKVTFRPVPITAGGAFSGWMDNLPREGEVIYVDDARDDDAATWLVTRVHHHVVTGTNPNNPDELSVGADVYVVPYA